MKPDQPLTLEQTLEALHQASEDSLLLDEVLAMKSEQIDAELAKAGVDVAALDVRLAAREAEIRTLQDQPEPAKSSLMASIRAASRKVIALFLAIGVALGAAGSYAVELITAATRVPLPPLTAFTAPPPSPAAELRTKGFEACGRGHWQECLDDFDKAKTADPSGDAALDVQNARATASRGLGR
jgi:hypothetical protein